MTTGIDAIQTGAPVTATGGVCFADPDVTLPTDALEALESDFTKGGFIGEDGVTRSIDATDDKIRAWGGDTVKIVRTDHSITYTWQFLESANAEVLKLINGEENVIIDGTNIEVRHTSKIPPRKAFVLDMADGDKRIREVIPNGQLTSSGEVNFVHSDVIRYAVTLESFPVDGNVKAISYMGEVDSGN